MIGSSSDEINTSHHSLHSSRALSGALPLGDVPGFSHFPRGSIPIFPIGFPTT